jgi:hypothetical protein
MKLPAQQTEQNMKTNVPIRKQRVEVKSKPADIQRRMSAGWLRLWRTVYPNTPPPGDRPRSKVQTSKSKSVTPAPCHRGLPLPVSLRLPHLLRQMPHLVRPYTG